MLQEKQREGDIKTHQSYLPQSSSPPTLCWHNFKLKVNTLSTPYYVPPHHSTAHVTHVANVHESELQFFTMLFPNYLQESEQTQLSVSHMRKSCSDFPQTSKLLSPYDNILEPSVYHGLSPIDKYNKNTSSTQRKKEGFKRTN